MSLESAIPQHLRCPRTRAARFSGEYVPLSPAHVARFRPSVKQFTMAYYGVQCRDARDGPRAVGWLNDLKKLFLHDDGPNHSDRSFYVDEVGYLTYLEVVYWDSPEAFDRWSRSERVHDWWARCQEEASIGKFSEIYSPRATHTETLISKRDKFEGVAVTAQGPSGEIQEHGYWGGARDRLPASQTDALMPSGRLVRHSVGQGRLKVQGHDNIALIRSGQDWSETVGEERLFYIDRIEPVLKLGMEYLRDNGASIGCYFNRYLARVDSAEAPLEQSFGLSAWRSLEHLERWAESHPTHLAIYGSLMGMKRALNRKFRLRLYHEVSVVRADEQHFEYVNCHPQTGFLKVARI